MEKRLIFYATLITVTPLSVAQKLDNPDHQVTRIGIKIPEHLSDALDHLAYALERLSASNVKTAVSIDLTDHSKKTLQEVSSAMKKVSFTSESNLFVNTEWNKIDALWKRMCTAFVGCILSCFSAGYLNKNIHALMRRKDIMHLFSTTLSGLLLYSGLFIIQKNDVALDLFDNQIQDWFKGS